jgi:hypothetical protein
MTTRLLLKKLFKKDCKKINRIKNLILIVKLKIFFYFPIPKKFAIFGDIHLVKLDDAISHDFKSVAKERVANWAGHPIIVPIFLYFIFISVFGGD